jgi:hypothetical protein
MNSIGQLFSIQRAHTTSLELPADGGRTGLKQPGHMTHADLFIRRRGFIFPHQDLKILSVDVGKMFTFLAFPDILAMAHVNPPDVFVVIPSYRVLMSFSVSLHSTTRPIPILRGSPLITAVGMCIIGRYAAFVFNFLC